MADSASNDPYLIKLRALRDIFNSVEVLANVLRYKQGIKNKSYSRSHMELFVKGDYPIPESLHTRIIEVYESVFIR